MPMYTRSYVRRYYPTRRVVQSVVPYVRKQMGRNYNSYRRTTYRRRNYYRRRPARFNRGPVRRPLGHEGITEDAWALLSEADRLARIQAAAEKEAINLRSQLARFAGRGDATSVKRANELTDAIDMNLKIAENNMEPTTQYMIRALLSVKPMSALRAMATAPVVVR